MFHISINDIHEEDNKIIYNNTEEENKQKEFEYKILIGKENNNTYW